VSISALGFCLIYLISVKKFDTTFFKTPVFLLVMMQAVILLFGLTHSPDLSQGYADTERYGYAILLPFLIYQMRNSGITTASLIVAFASGCTILILYGFGYLLVNSSDAQGKTFWDLGHLYFTEPMDIHPMYLSLYIIFIIFFMLEMLRINYSTYSLVHFSTIGLLLISLVIVLFFVRSQMSLLSFVTMSVLYIVIVLKRRAWLVTFVLFTIGFLVFLLDSNRVSTFFDTYGKNVSSALDNRFKVWRGAIEAIKESPIIGAGTGGEYLVLNKAYDKIGYTEGEINSYNAHNQYLEFLVRNGPIELLVFLALIVFAFMRAIQFPNYLFLLFCMMITLSMLSESTLQVHKGIVFFYFFLSTFIFLPFENTAHHIDSKENP
jgi:O-antigen ligase